MNELQRSESVRLLGEGTTFSETWALVHVNRADAERDYLQGKRDAENDVRSELADFYRGAAAARARIRAELRAEAREAAGSRAASDALHLLEAISAEEEPTALASDGDMRGDSPILSLVDKIETEEDPIERERLQAVQRNAELALHELFAESTRPREGVAA